MIIARAALIATLAAGAAGAQHRQAPEGIWLGWDGEWQHVSTQLLSLAEATPADKFGWRPAPGVRSTGEVYIHVAITSLQMLKIMGVAIPPGLKFSDETEKSVTGKAEIVGWLRTALEAMKTAHPKANLQRPVKIGGRDSTEEAIYLRALLHANEHMGQLVAYARINGQTPPWSQ
jgi:hypothetical protein